MPGFAPFVIRIDGPATVTHTTKVVASGGERGRDMLQPSFAAGKAANDNFISAGGASRRPAHIGSTRPAHIGSTHRARWDLRIAVRLLPIASFSAVVLLAFCGAFLVGLAFVGLFAAGVAGFDLVRRQMLALRRTVVPAV